MRGWRCDPNTSKWDSRCHSILEDKKSLQVPRLLFGLLLPAALILSSAAAEGQVVVSVAGGLDMHSTEPGMGSTGFYGESSLRVSLGQLVSLELAVGRHARELDLPAHGYTLYDHLSLRQYPIMLCVLLTPALSSSTRLLVPLGAFVAPTRLTESYQTYGNPPFSSQWSGTNYGVLFGLGFEATMSRHASLTLLTRYISTQQQADSLRPSPPNYLAFAVGAGYRF